jgi:multiple sugar transport system ATP-binding protein
MNFLHGKLSQFNGSTVFESATLRLDAQAYPFRSPAVFNQEVILGVRPESLLLNPQGALEARVSLIEPMGSHHVVWMEFGGALWSSTVSGALDVRVDEAVRFDIDLTKITLLDRATEQRL